MKHLITALMLLPASALADIDLTLSRAGTQSPDILDGYSIKAALNRGDWNLWASYADHDQVIVTQSAGNLSIIGVGLGYESSLNDMVSLYLDAGMATVKGSYDPRIMAEATWFSFKPTFDEAHWQPDDNYLDPDITLDNDFEQAPLVRIGAQFRMTRQLSFDVSYRWLHVTQFMKISNTTTADNGWWEGKFDRNMSAVSVGFNWRF